MANLLLVLGAFFSFFSGVASTLLPPTTTPPPDGCNYYTILSGADRAQEYKLPIKSCDQTDLVRGWYRFQGAAGDRIPNQCVPKRRCGTHAPGWLNGSHPTVAEGVVNRTVCYHWKNNCCHWNNDIRVRNCGAYFVYELPKTPACNLRYCGNAGVPTAAPGNFTISSSFPLSLDVSWDAITAEKQHGKLQGYYVFYKIEGSTAEQNKSVGPDQLSYRLTGLQYVNYSVRVAGYTAAGVGNSTVPLVKRPMAGAPPLIYYVDPATEAGTEENVTLTCHANGLPEPTFTWITPDGNVINTTAPVYENKFLGSDGENKTAGKLLQKDGSLLIFNTRVYDQGIYKCVAINVMGKDERSVNLTVREASLGRVEIDECQASELCHEKAYCVNTPKSYNCTCLDGYFGNGTHCQAPPSIYFVDPATEAGTEENVTLTCHANGLPEPTFTWITPDGNVINTTAPVYENNIFGSDGENKAGKVLQKDGSLLIFNTRVHDQGIYKCVAINVMGKDERSVNLTVREDLVGVDVAITIEEVFDKELENKSSSRYKKMKKEVERELTVLFQDIEGFKRIEILKFTNGSVKVHFRVVVETPKDKEHSEVTKKVVNTLNSVEKIGNRTVKFVEVIELPPPPVDVQVADVKQTEAVIKWSHPEQYRMYRISSYSLQTRKLGTDNWTQYTTTPGENHRLTNLEPDTVYFARLKSENKYGRGKPSESGELRTEKVPEGNTLTLILAIVSVLFLLVLVIVAVLVFKRWKNKGKRRGYQTTDEEVPMNPVTAETTEPVSQGTVGTIQLPASFSWRKIPRDRICTLDKVLGEGEFGMVVKGELTEDNGQITPCAVKKLKHNATESDLRDLLNELEIMASVGHHPNLVNLIGACSGGGQLMIVVEFAEHGNLLRHLRDHRKQNFEDMNEYSLDISAAERLRIACDVSDGMKHLTTMKWVHRDLAARNVLLGEGLVAKVCDFGLTRDIYTDNVYEKKSGGKVPVKWLAIESIEQGLYTSQSDVWSFGVLLWEIETGGSSPYAGISNRELLSQLKAGYRLEKPRYCTVELYTIMLRCWNANPNTRPTFEELSDELRQMYRKGTDYLTPDECSLDPSYDYSYHTTHDNTSVATENHAAFPAISPTSLLLADCSCQNGAEEA